MPLTDVGEGDRARLADAVSGTVLAAVGLGFGVAAARIPLESPLWAPYTSPGVYPLALSGLLLVGGAWVAARAWKAGVSVPNGEQLRRAFRAWGGLELLVSLAAIAAYLVLLGRVPFALAAGLFVVGTAVALGREPAALRLSLWGAACVAFLSEVVFQRLLGARLP